VSEVFVSVVIPTQNRWKKLERLLVSVMASQLSNCDLEIIVVADNCVDETIDAVSERFPDVKLIVAPSGTGDQLFGCAKSRHLGASFANGPYLCFIDDDNIVDPQMLYQLVEVLRTSEKIGAVGPVMMRWPDGSGVWCAGMKRDSLGFNHYLRSQRVLSGVDESGLLPTCDFIPNVFCTRKSTLLSVPFDVQRFPHNGAELDWGIRIQEAGLNMRISTKARDWHDLGYESFTTRIDNAALVHDQARCRVILRYVHPPRFSPSFAFWILWFPLISAYFSVRFLRSGNFFRLAKAYVDGTIDGLRIAKSSPDF